MMKNLIISIFLVLLPIIGISQIIVERSNNYNNLPADFKKTGNYYIKDVQNYLNDFVGTWAYTQGNKKFELILTKKIKYHVELSSSRISYNYYQDGINIQYKQYENGTLVFSSPQSNFPSLTSDDGINLRGGFIDHNRLRPDVLHPVTNEVLIPGGKAIMPRSYIKKIVTLPNEPKKIEFSLSCHVGCGRRNTIYEGLPQFSVPNDVVLTKQ